MPVNSIKIAKISLPASAGEMGPSSTLALKVEYERGAIGADELHGLFDYTPVCAALKTAADAGCEAALNGFVDVTLAAQLGEQGIPHAQVRLIRKAVDAPRKSGHDGKAVCDGTVVRIADTVTADIRHGGIYEGAHRPEGDTHELLSYVIKLQCEDEAHALATKGLLDSGSPDVREKARDCFSALREGRALEVVNGAILEMLKGHLNVENEFSSQFGYKLSIKRPAVLSNVIPGATVVVGQAHWKDGMFAAKRPAPRASRAGYQMEP